jgi:hypothetical protein
MDPSASYQIYEYYTLNTGRLWILLQATRYKTTLTGIRVGCGSFCQLPDIGILYLEYR